MGRSLRSNRIEMEFPAEAVPVNQMRNGGGAGFGHEMSGDIEVPGKRYALPPSGPSSPFLKQRGELFKS